MKFPKRSSKDYLDSLGDLKKGWDSYGGEPITEAAREAAWRFVEDIRAGRFTFVPCSDGGVQIDTYHSDELSWKADGELDLD